MPDTDTAPLDLATRVLRAAPQPTLLTSLDGRILWQNYASRRSHGDLVGRALPDITMNRTSSINRVLEIVRGMSIAMQASLDFPGSHQIWNVWRAEVARDHPHVIVFQVGTKQSLLADLRRVQREAVRAASERDRAASAIRRKERELVHLISKTQTDSLTGLMNAESFELFVKRALSAPAVSGAFVFADLNEFKTVNDTHGHDAGDAVLIEIARRFQEETRSADAVARLSGDEFALWLDGLTADTVAPTLQRLRDVSRTPILWRRVLDGREIELRVSASFGEAFAPCDGTTFDTLKAVSDARMYRHKNGHRTASAG